MARSAKYVIAAFGHPPAAEEGRIQAKASLRCWLGLTRSDGIRIVLLSPRKGIQAETECDCHHSDCGRTIERIHGESPFSAEFGLLA